MADRMCSVGGCDAPHEARGYCSTHYARWRKHGDPGPARLLRNVQHGASAEERFLAKVNKREGGCWEWTSSVAGTYGRFHWNGRQGQAHRFAYEHFVGPIPDGLEIDHLCRNRLCVNPDHLEPVTREENLRRGLNPRRDATHCKYGHEFTPENTYIGRNGHRFCRACILRRSRVRQNYQGNPPSALRTHCKHGHPFDEANTYVSEEGWRSCRACGRESARRGRARRRAA